MRLRKVLASAMAALTLASGACILGEMTTADTTKKNGFSYDESSLNVDWKTDSRYVVKVTSEKGGILGTMSYTVGCARWKDSDDYIVMFRETMKPNSERVQLKDGIMSSALGVESGYGLSEYVSVKAILPSLDGYSPQNGDTKVTFGSGEAVAYDPPDENDVDNLEITSCSNTSSKTYCVIYDYKPNVLSLFSGNKYVTDESSQFGRADFSSSDDSVSFDVEYDVRFGAATTEARSPWSVKKGYIRTKTDSRHFTFNMEK